MPDMRNNDWRLDLKPVHLPPSDEPTTGAVSTEAVAPQDSRAGAQPTDAMMASLERIEARLAKIESVLAIAPLPTEMEAAERRNRVRTTSRDLRKAATAAITEAPPRAG